MVDHLQVIKDDITAHEITANGDMQRVHAARWAVEEIVALRSLCLDAAAALVGPSDTFEGCQDVIDKIHAHMGLNVSTDRRVDSRLFTRQEVEKVFYDQEGGSDG